LNIFSLKRLQVADLVSRRGIFDRRNFSIPIDDFLDVINQFQKSIDSSNVKLEAVWLNIFTVLFAEIITEFGLCYTFNIANYSKLFSDPDISDDFHYHFNLLDDKKYEDAGEDYPFKIASTTNGLSAKYEFYSLDFFDSTVFVRTIFLLGNLIQYMTSVFFFNKENNGIKVLIHDPFELPSRDSLHINADINLNVFLFVDPTLKSIDDSMIDLSPDE
jgi:Amiloride-sensitive sodium channel